jgi:hypothetical protein
MGHITNDQRALVSSAHQTAISNFNLYAVRHTSQAHSTSA